MSEQLTAKDLNNLAERSRRNDQAKIYRDPQYELCWEDSFFVGSSVYDSYIDPDRVFPTGIISFLAVIVTLVVSSDAKLFEGTTAAYIGLSAAVFLVLPVFLEIFWGFGRAFFRKDSARNEAIAQINKIPSEMYIIRAFEARCEELRKSVQPESESAFSTYLRSLLDRLSSTDGVPVDDLQEMIDACESVRSDIGRECQLIDEKLTRIRALIEERKAYVKDDAHLFGDMTLTKDDINASIYAVLTEVRDGLGRLQSLRSQTLTGAALAEFD